MAKFGLFYFSGPGNPDHHPRALRITTKNLTSTKQLSWTDKFITIKCNAELLNNSDVAHGFLSQKSA
jgi:hypothetical protein